MNSNVLNSNEIYQIEQNLMKPAGRTYAIIFKILEHTSVLSLGTILI